MYVPSKTESFVKFFFLMSCVGLIMYLLLAFYTFQTAFSSIFHIQKSQQHDPALPYMDMEVGNKKYKDLKYILLWTTPNNSLNSIGEGQTPFIVRSCLHTNCFITSDKYLLKEDYTNFELIIFDVNDLRKWKDMKFPEKRASGQKYVFHSHTSSYNAPVCNHLADDYFNLTWTYKLNSDFVSTFIEVIDFNGTLVAPKESVVWKTNTSDVTKELSTILRQKKKAMAWIVTKCNTPSDRMLYAKMLRSAMEKKSLSFDIYGCEFLKCPKIGCSELIKREYYFYFAAEDSNTDDYVTDEVVIAYNSYAVPIVLGGANYRKFLPEGSYVNVRNSTFEQLIELVQFTLKNPEMYKEFHHWRKYYTINKADRYKGICEICEYLNNESKLETAQIVKNLRKWWYPGKLYQRCIPKDNVEFFVNETPTSRQKEVK